MPNPVASQVGSHSTGKRAEPPLSETFSGTTQRHVLGYHSVVTWLGTSPVLPTNHRTASAKQGPF